MSKNEMTYVERSLYELRKEINIVTEDELKEKNFVCTFSDKTHKLTSIQKKEDVDKSNEYYKKKFYQLIEDIETKCHKKISLTASLRLRTFNEVTDLPKPNPRKKSKTMNDDAEQTEQQVA